MTEPLNINDQRFEDLATRLAAITPCPFAGYITPNQMKIALGEHGDIWPQSIRAMANHGEFKQALEDFPLTA